MEDDKSKLHFKKLTDAIIASAIDVHKALGPGLLESAYEACLAREFEIRSISYTRQINVPLEYKGIRLDCGYRVDLLVQDSVVLEIKTVEKILPVHEAQLLTYMKLLQKPVGMIFNFHTELLKNGIVRRVL